MSDVTFAIAFADVSGFPAGSVVSHVDLTVLAPDGASTVRSLRPDETSVTLAFDVVGDYSATVQAIDASGALLGNPALAAFSISAPATVTLSLPASLTASVA